MKSITVGSAKSKPGKITYGFIDALPQPTGTVDRIPVIIAQGKEDGPTFFMTANVHGNELTGVAIIHETITEELVGKLKGTIIAIPTLNPSGLKQSTRTSEYGEADPNRLYPEGWFVKEEDKDDDEKKHPKPYEQVAAKIFSYIKEYADYHIDFHNHTIRSIPYSIIDRIFYKDESEREDALTLHKKQKEMVEAFGVIYTADFPPKRYMQLKYHRSVSGAVLNGLRIPAFTVELGANTILVPEIVAGSVKGTRNLLRWAGMLEGPREEITEFDVTQPKERLQRIEHPRASDSGIIKFLVNPGEKVSAGQKIAKFTDIFGRPIGDGYIRTDYEGYMIALHSEITIYPHGSISEMGIKDDAEMVSPFPLKKDSD
jgi:predicted deacylase